MQMLFLKGDDSVEQKRITPLTTAGCFAAVMLILALLSTFMPFFSFVGYFIMPIPMTIIYMKYGMRQALLLGVVVGILMGIFIDPLTAVAQLITFASVGLAIGAGFRYEWAPAKMLACVAAALIAATGVLLGLMYIVLDINLLAAVYSAFDTVVADTIAQYKASGMSDIQLAEARTQLEEVRRLLPSMLPMFLCLAMAVIAYINVKISQLVLVRLGFSIKPFLPIRYSGPGLPVLFPRPPLSYQHGVAGAHYHFVFCHARVFLCGLRRRIDGHAFELSQETQYDVMPRGKSYAEGNAVKTKRGALFPHYGLAADYYRRI